MEDCLQCDTSLSWLQLANLTIVIGEGENKMEFCGQHCWEGWMDKQEDIAPNSEVEKQEESAEDFGKFLMELRMRGSPTRQG